MEQRDFLIREIEKIGEMVMGLIGKLKRHREEEQYAFGLTLADEEFKSETGFTISQLARMDEADLKAFIDANPSMNSRNMDLLADLLIEYGDQTQADAKLFLCQAFRILKLVDQRDKIFSMERATRMEFLEGEMED